MSACQYISRIGDENVKKFQYKGGSDSILYTHLWSPLCNWIVANLIPKWVAPNVITTIGFALHIFTHILVLIYSPDLHSEIPSWLCYLLCFSLLTYQILDNCDGKQARATQSSSPLGMLCDHGCDTVSTWVVTLNTLAVLRTQTMLAYYTVLFVGLISFYFAMWSQYHAGSFKLGYINAVDEGLVAAELVYLVTGILGQQIWQIKINFLGLNAGELLVYSTIIMGLMQMVQFSYDIYVISTQAFYSAMTHHASTILLIVTFYAVEKLVGEKFISDNFIILCYALSFAWSKHITHIQVAHLTQEPFDQFKRTFLIACISIISASILHAINPTLFSTGFVSFVVFFTLVIAFSSYVHLVYSVFTHLADVLGIYIFKLGRKNSGKNGSSSRSSNAEDSAF